MATAGLQVTGVDIDPSRVDTINSGVVDHSEPNLSKTLQAALDSGSFHAETSVPNADVYVVAVPTPFDADRNFDNTFVNAAADSIAPKLNPGNLVILESTVPPLTTDNFADRIFAKRPDLVDHQGRETVHFAHCPERILPGNALIELKINDRIIGGRTALAAERAAAIYQTFCDGKLLLTDARTAELSKLAENSFRDVNIAFANELSMVCDKLDIDVWELIELANHHPRVQILQPGPGVGGHCIAVDPWFIISAAPDESKLIHCARKVNISKSRWIERKVLDLVGRYNQPTVAIFGITFKPDIPDLRQSPSLDIARNLSKALPDSDLLIVEPNIDSLPQGLGSAILTDIERALDECDVAILLVDHQEFKDIDPSQLRGTAIFDSKGIWNSR